MAVDKLVDSAKLDACCTAEANAIRAKTGGSAQIAYDFANSKGFADAIAAIPTGGAIDTVSGEASGSYGSLVYTFPSNGIYLLVNQHNPQGSSSSSPYYRSPRFLAVICDDTGVWTSDCVIYTFQNGTQVTGDTWSGKTMTVSGGSWYRFSSVTFDVYRCGDIPS